MDRIDHALGRPFDPLGETCRNRYVVNSNSETAAELFNSLHWKYQGGAGASGLVCFQVTQTGREALLEHLRANARNSQLFSVTFDGAECSPVVAETRGKAVYAAFLNIRDGCDITFSEFCRRASVQLVGSYRSPNVTKADVIDTITAHPDWTGPEIAAHLSCHSAYVRKVARAAGLTLPKRGARKPSAEILRERAAELMRQAEELERP
ncbi:hypothetical protein LZ190_21915, partial [Rhodovulum sulfidophilum]|nr:hypothetical protein [Rhodovulum sulfidophilum]